MTASVPGTGGAVAEPGRPSSGETARARAELGARVASAAVLMTAAIGTAWTGGHLFTIFWLAAALAVFLEWERMVVPGQRRDRRLVGTLALVASAPLAAGGLWMPAVAILLAAAATLAWRARSVPAPLAAGGVLYAGGLVVAVGTLRHSVPLGVLSILWLFAVVWGTDVMAFFGGRALGGPKLAPTISPSKTWSGFLVGVCSGSALGAAVAPGPGRLGAHLALGLVVAIASQGGDLFESALKRRSGVKDSGAIIPGHGGAMDRLDGFIAASVLAAILGVARLGGDAAGAGLLAW